MSLTPPSSRDASSIDGVTVTGTPSAGETIVADSATAAHWGAAGGSDGILNIQIEPLPILSAIKEGVVADFARNIASTMCSPPLSFGASDTAGFLIAVTDVPDISDTLDITYTLYITNQLGTSSGIVSGSTSTPTPAPSFQVDFTGTTATIVGVDLTWDDVGATFTSAAGGVYTALIYVTTGPD